MTTTETHQLTIARAIAYEIERHTGEPGWATESMTGGPAQWHLPGARPTPTPRPLTTLADARAAWVASGGDPERGPCLVWGGQGDHIAVRVCDTGWRVYVGNIERWPNGKTYVCGDLATPPDDLELLARIIRAVEEVTP